MALSGASYKYCPFQWELPSQPGNTHNRHNTRISQPTGQGSCGVFMDMLTYCADTLGFNILHSVKDYENLLSDPCCDRWIILLARLDIFIPWYLICSHFLAVTITGSITMLSLVWKQKTAFFHPSSTFTYLPHTRCLDLHESTTQHLIVRVNVALHPK